MTFAAGIVFGFSLFSILVLFLMKRYEVANGRLIGGSARDSADLFALRVKWVLMVIEWYLARTPDILLVFTRFGVRFLALSFARLARTAEGEAHRLADFVSHKRNFERRETKSNYLKQVGEHPIRSRSSEKDDGPVATS